MIRVQGLTKSFPASDRLAVDNLSLEIAEGDFFTLLGPSGCGKTTTLRCIAGLERPERGEIEIGGVTVFSSERRINLPPHRRPIGMVFQSYAIWPHMTVRQNIAYPLKNLRKSRAEIDEAVAWALSLVGLDGMADRPAPFLSGGEQQRVAFARALVERPKVLLLDEPLSNLDAKLRDEMRSELKLLQEKLAFTAIYVTHDQDDAFCLADTLALMHLGRIVELGVPEDVYDLPQTTFGAEFLGTATRLPGIVVGTDRDELLDVETSVGILRCRSRDALAHGAEVLVYVRPESVQPATGDGVSGALVLDATALNASFMGDTLEWTVDVHGTRLKARTLANTDAARAIKAGVGKPFRIQIPVVACVPAPRSDIARSRQGGWAAATVSSATPESIAPDRI